MTPEQLAKTLVRQLIDDRIKTLFNDSHLLGHFSLEELKECNDELIRISINLED